MFLGGNVLVLQPRTLVVVVAVVVVSVCVFVWWTGVFQKVWKARCKMTNGCWNSTTACSALLPNNIVTSSYIWWNMSYRHGAKDLKVWEDHQSLGSIGHGSYAFNVTDSPWSILTENKICSYKCCESSPCLRLWVTMAAIVETLLPW